jgi:hypothetical protein
MSAMPHSKRIAIFMEMMDYLMVSVLALTDEVKYVYSYFNITQLPALEKRNKELED